MLLVAQFPLQVGCIWKNEAEFVIKFAAAFRFEVSQQQNDSLINCLLAKTRDISYRCLNDEQLKIPSQQETAVQKQGVKAHALTACWMMHLTERGQAFHSARFQQNLQHALEPAPSRHSEQDECHSRCSA
ncbi:hypothetical protein Anapl_02136 [Anas platyrhynchos]|uniref:Uncharacterized protein n=1 Tax=Anas platyrhynchos TaxID=8839 RepID=R0K506_ANAPL|nr:hypothetical protein Anapl_02136 [Anas platyrhynchos]